MQPRFGLHSTCQKKIGDEGDIDHIRRTLFCADNDGCCNTNVVDPAGGKLRFIHIHP